MKQLAIKLLIKKYQQEKEKVKNQKDVINDLLSRIANLERNIEEGREFLIHSSISLEDMERIDDIFGF